MSGFRCFGRIRRAHGHQAEGAGFLNRSGEHGAQDDEDKHGAADGGDHAADARHGKGQLSGFR
ncbi:MAG: hypothetical protein RQ897_13940, partial [Thermoflexus sp.]